MVLESRQEGFCRDQVARLNEEVSLVEKSCLTSRGDYETGPPIVELTLLGSPGFKSSSCVMEVLLATAVEPIYSVVSRGETQGRLVARTWGVSIHRLLRPKRA